MERSHHSYTLVPKKFFFLMHGCSKFAKDQHMYGGSCDLLQVKGIYLHVTLLDEDKPMRWHCGFPNKVL